MTNEDVEFRVVAIIVHVMIAIVCAFVFIFSGSTFFLYLCVGFFVMAFYNLFRVM